MKLFNISDVLTPKLKQHGLHAQTVAIGRLLLSPGESGTLEDQEAALHLANIQKMTSVGLLAVTEPPADYRVAKERVASAPQPAAAASVAATEEPKKLKKEAP